METNFLLPLGVWMTNCFEPYMWDKLPLRPAPDGLGSRIVLSTCHPTAGWQKRLCKAQHWGREAHLPCTFNNYPVCQLLDSTIWGEIPFNDRVLSFLWLDTWRFALDRITWEGQNGVNLQWILLSATYLAHADIVYHSTLHLMLECKSIWYILLLILKHKRYIGAVFLKSCG